MAKTIANQQTKGKRQTIMDSAFTLFFSKGYKNTKIIEIAELASIGKGTFYEYFESKESLLFELLKAKFDLDKQKLESIADADLSGIEKIKSFIQFELECMEKYGPTSNALAQEMMSPSFNASGEILEIIHKTFTYKHAFINKVILAGIEKKEFKPIDSTLASAGILGAISFYTALKFKIMNHNIIPGLPFNNIGWNNEEFFQLIFTGLK